MGYQRRAVRLRKRLSDQIVNRTDTASRRIAATPEKIFGALIDADALTSWLPPSAMTGRFEHFDARPGGSYRLILTFLNATEGHGKATNTSDIVEARFVDIVPNARVVQAIDFVSDDPAFAGTMTMTWQIVPVGEKTRVEIRAENVPTGIPSEDHAIGLESSLANLAEYTE
jgi:uncharacterized protein YndB with AHSA1/START domain